MAQFFPDVNFIPKYLNNFALIAESKRYTHLSLPDINFYKKKL